MSDYENIGDEVENAIVYALEAMRDSKVWRGPLRIDGTVKEFAEDVLSFVRAADDMKEGRNVVSLGTYQAATEENDALREQVATTSAALTAAGFVTGGLQEQVTECIAAGLRLTKENERKDATIATLTAEQPNVILQQAYAMACRERDEARADVERLTKENETHRKTLASVCIDILTSPAVTDTMWCHDSGLSTTNDYIASALGIDTVTPQGAPSEALLSLATSSYAKKTDEVKS